MPWERPKPCAAAGVKGGSAPLVKTLQLKNTSKEKYSIQVQKFMHKLPKKLYCGDLFKKNLLKKELRSEKRAFFTQALLIQKIYFKSFCLKLLRILIQSSTLIGQF